MGKVRDFLSFVFAILFKTDEDADTFWNKATRWLARLTLGAGVSSVLVPAGKGAYVSLEVLADPWMRPLSFGTFLALAFWGAFEKYTFEKGRYQEAVEKRLGIVFSWADCLKTNAKYSDDGKLIGCETIIRIGIANKSLKTVRNVTVKRLGGSNVLFLGVDPGQQFQRTHAGFEQFDLNPSNQSATLYELVRYNYREGEASDMAMLYGNAFGASIANASAFTLLVDIEVQGEDCRAERATVKIVMDPSGMATRNPIWPVWVELLEYSPDAPRLGPE